jgi:hypothetical protein
MADAFAGKETHQCGKVKPGKSNGRGDPNSGVNHFS